MPADGPMGKPQPQRVKGDVPAIGQTPVSGGTRHEVTLDMSTVEALLDDPASAQGTLSHRL